MVLSSLLGTSKTPPKDRDSDNADDMEELDDENGSILLSLIGQLRIGMDLSRVTLPTFVLEPRSMLERITDFMSHPDLIFGAAALDDPVQRFVAVMRYYLAGWHIKPKGVKKPYVVSLPPLRTPHPILSPSAFCLRGRPSSSPPNPEARLLTLADPPVLRAFRYNPVIGEFFQCSYTYADGSHGYYIAEQGTPMPLVALACSASAEASSSLG